MALVLACAFFESSAGLAQEEGPRQSIAVLPVMVHSAEDPDYLRAGLADMLSSRIEQADVLDVVRVEDPSAATTSVEAAIATGRELGVDFVLFGSFTRFGDGASLDMQCVATDPLPGQETLREVFVHSGSIGEVIPDLQDLVGKMSRFVVTDAVERSAAAGEGAPPAALQTRIVIETEAGEETGEAAAPEPEAQPTPDLSQETEELRSRIQELEQAVKQLQDRLYDVEAAGDG